MYARIMSVSDALLLRYYEMCTDLDEEALDEIRHMLAGGVNPMTLKKRLARMLTAYYHDENAALRAEERFEREVQRHETPEEMPTARLGRGGEWNIVELLVEAGLAGSKSEARRLVEGGAGRVDDQVIRDPRATVVVGTGMMVRAGKRAYARLEVDEAA